MLPLTVSVSARLTAALAVMGAELAKVVAALNSAAAFALKTSSAVSVAAGAKVVGALTVTLLLASVPRVTLPKAIKLFPAVTVRAAAAVRGAAKVLAAFTVRLWLLLLPTVVLASTVVPNKVKSDSTATGAFTLIGPELDVNVV